MASCWKILGIDPTEDQSEIKRAWRRYSQKFHPDKVTTPELKRRFTIKFVNGKRAYKLAMKLSSQARSEAMQDTLSISAPDATDARDILCTHGLQKVACDGSTTTGKCVIS